MYKWNFFYNIKGLKYASFADDDTPYTCSPDIISVNPSVPGGNKKVRHTYAKLKLKAAGLFKYV